MLPVFYCGAAAKADKSIASLRDFGTPLGEHIGAQPYVQWQKAFDPLLNPIRAKVSLGMRVLTVDDLGFDVKGGNLFMAYLQNKERLASQSRAGTLSALGLTGLP